jgi:2-methylcitrate dehydratase PrpD
LNEAQTASALGIAATQAAGLVEVLGSMARVLNAGFAARNGIAAARLAREGFEGPRAPIEGLRGFMNVFGGNNDPARITQGLGGRWEIMQVAYKPYPSGVVLHALIDACLEHREKLRRAQSIVVQMHPLAIERTDRGEPRNAIEARLSAQHAVAVALLHGAAGLAQFSDPAALDPEVRRERQRVSVVPDPTLDKMAARIRADAATFEAPAARPMDDARLEAKFRALAGAHAARLLDTMRALEGLREVVLP